MLGYGGQWFLVVKQRSSEDALSKGGVTVQVQYGKREAQAVSNQQIADYLGIAAGIVTPTLSHLVEVATDLVERYTLRATSKRSYTVYFQNPPRIVTLPFPPLVSIEKVEGLTDRKWEEITDYEVLPTPTAKVIGDWPRYIRITYVAGHEPDDLPDDLRDAILRVLSARWELRSTNVMPDCAKLQDRHVWQQLENC